MNFNNQYSRPFYPHGPPFNPYRIPPWMPPFPQNIPPPCMLPPYGLPPDSRIMNNPYNPLLVYQTNNYYSSPSEVKPHLPNLNPYLGKNIPDNHSFERGQHSSSLSKKEISKLTIGRPASSKAPQIIEIQSSDGEQNVKPVKMVPKKKSKPLITNKNQIQSESPFQRKIHIPKDQEKRAEIQRQFQQNLKKMLNGEPRRSQRKAKAPQRYKFLTDEEEQQKERTQMTQPFILSKNKLIFKYKVTESQKLQLCLSKLREMKAQIMIGPLYQAIIPSPINNKKEQLKEIRQDLEMRAFE